MLTGATSGIVKPAIAKGSERGAPKFTYTFVCHLCCKQFKSDEPGEPCCTGPSETLDDHPMELMRLLRIDKHDVHPRLAEQRAEGRLIMPNETEVIKRDARLLVVNG